MKMKNIIEKSMAHVLSVLMILSVMASGISVSSKVITQNVYAASVSEIKAGDHITMGKADAAGYTGMPYWRVLDIEEDGTLFLMSEYLWNGNSGISQYGKIAFRQQGTGNAWQGSNARKWCADFYAAVLSGVDGLTVLETDTTDQAWTWVAANTSSTYVAYEFLEAENILNKDKVFFLSAEEIQKYMPEAKDRVAYEPDEMTSQSWWSRSPEKTTTDLGNLINVGNILKNGKYNKGSVWSECYARPAFRCALSPDLCIKGTEKEGTTDWEIVAQKHELGEATYTWAEDHSSCTAKALCSTCGDEVSETAVSVKEIVEEPTTEKEGLAKYTAKFKISAFETREETAPELKLEPAPEPSPKSETASGVKPESSNVTTAPLVINSSKITASDVKKAVKAAAAKGENAREFVLGPKVKKVAKAAFKGTNVKTIVVKTKKLKKASVKGSLKGSKVTTVKVKVGKAKTNKKYVKKYRKIFTKKNAGRKVKVR